MRPTLEHWADPVFGLEFDAVPVDLVSRLAGLASELGADTPAVLAAVRDARISAGGDLPRGAVHVGLLPNSARVYYERLYGLLTLAHLADAYAARPTLAARAGDDDNVFGLAIAQAFHNGCSLADVELATGLSGPDVMKIGKRTIRRTTWQERVEGSKR